jgi:hypothetical protein
MRAPRGLLGPCLARALNLPAEGRFSTRVAVVVAERN